MLVLKQSSRKRECDVATTHVSKKLSTNCTILCECEGPFRNHQCRRAGPTPQALPYAPPSFTAAHCNLALTFTRTSLARTHARNITHARTHTHTHPTPPTHTHTITPSHTTRIRLHRRPSGRGGRDLGQERRQNHFLQRICA